MPTTRDKVTLNPGTGGADTDAAKFNLGAGDRWAQCVVPIHGTGLELYDASGNPVGTQAVKLALPATSALTGTKVDCAGSGDNTLIAAGGGSVTNRVHRIFLVFAAACTFSFKCGSTAQTGAMTATAGGSFVLDLSSEPWFVTGAAEAFVLNLSSAVQVSGRVYSTAS